MKIARINFWPNSILLLLIIVCACKSSKKTTIGNLTIKPAAELNHAIKGQHKSYDWLSIKARLKYVDPYQSIGGTLHIKAKKDSLIWLRVTKFGFEGARVRIMPNSIEVINRVDKTYQKRTLSSIQNEYGIDLTFKDIEDLLVGNQIYQDLPYQSALDSSGYILSTSTYPLGISYHLRPLDLFIDQMHLIQHNQGSISATFDDYEDYSDNGWNLSKKRSYRTEEKNGEIKSIDLKISSVQLNSPTNIIFSIPNHYERIP